MKKNKQELKSVLFELSTPDERAKLAANGINDLLDKFNNLYASFKATIEDRDNEYGQAIELLIQETDKQVKSYLTQVQRDTDGKIRQINSLISQLETLSNTSDDDLKGQIKEAKTELKSEIKDFKDKINETYVFYRDETKNLVSESRKSVMSLDEKTSKLVQEIESTRKEFADRFSKFVSQNRGGAAHRKLLINGTAVATKYADVNYVVSGWVATNDDTNKVTKITIGAGTTLTEETPTGDVDDSNVTFTVSNEPLYIIVNGAQYAVGTGLYSSYAAGTITLSSPVGTGGFIRSYYNA